jgi:hypothetical protein
MCHYNFLILENKNSENNVLKIANDSGFLFKGVMTNFTVKNLNAYVTDLTGDDNCNCGSIIGMNIWNDNEIFDIEKERKKLERKRFSQKRIEELLIQKQENWQTRKFEYDVSKNTEGEKWIAFFKNLSKEKVIDKVGILFHDYRYGIADEIVKIQEANCELKTINVEVLRNLKEDYLYWMKS